MEHHPDSGERHCFGCPFKSKLFQLLSDEELEVMNSHRSTVVFKKGETIRKQGTPMTHVLSVSRGMAKLYLEGLKDRNAILRIVTPMNFIGGPGIYYDQMHHFTVTALAESVVCFIEMNVFKEVLASNRSFNEEFMKDVSRNTLRVYNRLINLTQKQMPGRIADALIYLMDEVFMDSKIPRIITIQDFSEMSGMSKESAVKALRELDHDGIIRVGDNEIDVLNVEAVRHLSRVG